MDQQPKISSDTGAPAGTVPWTILGPTIRGRSCGSCTACCTLVPVSSHGLEKPAGQRCQHLCSRGCSIYSKRPKPCQYWSCRWLFDEGTADMRRPDRSGVVVDSMPDTILVNGQAREVMQIWCDPKRPDAHRDPSVRAYMAEVARVQRMATIVRWSSESGLVVVAPVLTGFADWYEQRSELKSKAFIRERMEEVGAKPPRLTATLA